MTLEAGQLPPRTGSGKWLRDGGGGLLFDVIADADLPGTLVRTVDPRLADARTPLDGSVTPAKLASSVIDPAANVAGARTIGTGAQQAAPGTVAALIDVPLGWIDATQFATPVVADCIRGTTGQAMPGSTAFTDANAHWAPADAGKLITIATVGAVKQNTAGRIASGDNQLYLDQSANLQIGDVGKVIEVAGAGPGGAVLRSTITYLTAAGQVTLANAASTSVSGATVTWSGALATTIQSVTDSTHIVLATSVSAAWTGGALTGLQYDYGTDNNAALQALIATGKNFVIPAGRYARSANLTITSQSVRGAGEFATILVGMCSDAAPAHSFQMLGQSPTVEDLQLANPYMTVRSTGTGGIGIQPNGALDWRIRRVIVNGSAGNAFKATSTATNPCLRGRYESCEAWNAIADGFDFVCAGQDCAYNVGLACKAVNCGDDAFASSSPMGAVGGGLNPGQAHHNRFEDCFSVGSYNGAASATNSGGAANCAGGYANSFSVTSYQPGGPSARMVCSQPNYRTTSGQTAAITSGLKTLIFSSPFTTTLTNDVTCTAGQTAITSAGGKFATNMVGFPVVSIAGATLPAGTYIASVQDIFHATLSAAPTVGASGATATLITAADATTNPVNQTELMVFGAGAAGGDLISTVHQVVDSQTLVLDVAAGTTVSAAYVQGGPKNTSGRYGSYPVKDVRMDIISDGAGRKDIAGTFAAVYLAAFSSRNYIQDVEVNLLARNTNGNFFATVQSVVGDVTRDQLIKGVTLNIRADTNAASVDEAAPEGISLNAGRDFRIRGRVSNTMGPALDVAVANNIGGDIEIDLEVADINKAGATGNSTAAVHINPTQAADCVPRIVKVSHSNPSGTAGGTRYVVGYVLDAQINGAVHGDIRSNVSGQALANTSSNRWHQIGLSGSLFRGSGSPNGVITANVGSIYQRRDGASGTSVYIKEVGSDANGWTALVSAAGVGGFATLIRRTADSLSLTSQTTPQADDTLILPVGASDVWLVEAILLVNAANATMDFTAGWSAPTGATFAWGAGSGAANSLAGFGTFAAATTPTVLKTVSQTLTVGTAIGSTGVSLTGIYAGDGTHSGNLTLKWSQATSDAGALILQANSLLRCTRIA